MVKTKLMKDKQNVKRIPSWIKGIIIVGIIAVIAFAVILIDRAGIAPARELSIGEAQDLVDSTFLTLPKVATIMKGNVNVEVLAVKNGSDRQFILECKYTAKDIEKVISDSKDELFTEVYKFYKERTESGVKTSGTNVRTKVAYPIIKNAFEAAPEINGEAQLYAYQLNDGSIALHLSDEAVNTCFGGILDAVNNIASTNTIIYEGKEVDIGYLNTLRTGITDCISLTNYDSTEPNTGTALMRRWAELKDEFYRNFIQNDNWKHLAKGLVTTLEITFFALLIGILIGFLVAIIRVTYAKTGKLKILDTISRFYVSIIRGTPVMVQLLIIYFVMLLPLRQIMLGFSADLAANGNAVLSKIVSVFAIDKFGAAVLCFGLNSGAYVSEIVRGGIMSVDAGQTEAGRSLGFTYAQTMIHIVIPQAFKAVLPALANEFITLLKESSVAFYIGVGDLTKGGITIRSITYSNFMPLIAVALIYLIVVLGLTYLVSLLEKRLQKGDR